MKLNHINLVVPNVEAAVRLFETYFGFICIETKGDHIVAILKGTDDFTLVLMRPKDGNAAFPPAFHIGFMQEDAGTVSAIYRRLKEGGLAVGAEPRHMRDSFGFYFRFDNMTIEVGHYLNTPQEGTT